MPVTDSIADFLTRIRNAQGANHRTALVDHSKMNERLLKILKDEGYIGTFEAAKDRAGKFDMYKVYLRYDDFGFPLIRELKRASRPGRRVYKRSGDLKGVRCGLGVAIVSTSQGVMTDREAKRQGVGGEVLATVF